MRCVNRETPSNEDTASGKQMLGFSWSDSREQDDSMVDYKTPRYLRFGLAARGPMTS
jgi:hypothetical protein